MTTMLECTRYCFCGSPFLKLNFFNKSHNFLINFKPGTEVKKKKKGKKLRKEDKTLIHDCRPADSQLQFFTH